MILTVLLPTRGRPAMAKMAIDSLFNTAWDKNSLQVIVKIDHDDSFEYNHPNVIIIKSDRAKGYESLHTFANQMVKLATGLWVVLWNDDAIMITQGWDVILSKEQCENTLINTSSENGYTAIFPIVPTSICHKLGHFSLNAYTDRWLENVYVHKKNIDISIKHLNDNTDDQTRTDRINAPCDSDKDWEVTEQIRNTIRYDIEHGITY